MKIKFLFTSHLMLLIPLFFSTPARAEIFPKSAVGSWCSSTDPASPDFFIDRSSATMGIINCKVIKIRSDQITTDARLMCTNATGRHVEPMSLKIFGNNTLIRQQGSSEDVLKKCGCGANYDKFC